jgi:hypothetical protein
MAFNISLPVKFILPLYTNTLVGYLHCQIFIYKGKKILLLSGTQYISNNTSIPMVVRMSQKEVETKKESMYPQTIRKGAQKPPSQPKSIVEYPLLPGCTCFVPLTHSDAFVTIVPLHGAINESLGSHQQWEKTDCINIAGMTDGAHVFVCSRSELDYESVEHSPPMTFSVSCRDVVSDDFRNASLLLLRQVSNESPLTHLIADSQQDDRFGSNVIERLSPIDKYDKDVNPPDENVSVSFFCAKDIASETQNKKSLKQLRQYVISPGITVFNSMPLQIAVKFTQTPYLESSKESVKKTKQLYSSSPYIIFPGRYLTLYHLPIDIPLQIQICFPYPLLNNEVLFYLICS